METITFNGEEYPCRVIHELGGQEIKIATISLYDALHPYEWGGENDGFASKEAESIYDEIFYFVDKSEIKLPFEELKEILQEANPDWDFQP